MGSLICLHIAETSKAIGRIVNNAFEDHPKALQCIGIALIIICVVGLLVAGVAGYFHAGALSTTAVLIGASILMAFGGVGGGFIFTIVGINKLVKNCQPVDHSLNNNLHADPRDSHQDSIQQSNPISSEDTQDAWVYGPTRWKTLGEEWKCKLTAFGTKAPQENAKNDRVHIFIPQNIQIDETRKAFDLNTLKSINSGSLFEYCYPNLSINEKVNTSWIEINPQELKSGQVQIWRSIGKKEISPRKPSVLEAVAICLLAPDLLVSKEEDHRPIMIECLEKLPNNDPLFVGIATESKRLVVCPETFIWKFPQF